MCLCLPVGGCRGRTGWHLLSYPVPQLAEAHTHFYHLRHKSPEATSRVKRKFHTPRCSVCGANLSFFDIEQLKRLANMELFVGCPGGRQCRP